MNITKAVAVAALGALFSTGVLAQHSGGYGAYGGHSYGGHSGYGGQVAYGGHGGRGGQGGYGAYDGRYDGDIERRDAINNERIERGIRSGQITPREAYGLREQQARIERIEARARRDGFINERERERIEFAQRELSRDIRLERHDREARY